MSRLTASRGAALRRPLRTLAAALLLAACLPLVPAPAQAGTYRVYTCATPDDQPAPAVGWERVLNVPQAAIDTGWMAMDQCATNPRLAALLPSLTGLTTWKAGERAAWRFTAPDGTQLTRVEARRSITAVPADGDTGRVYGELRAEGGRTERCEVDACQNVGAPIEPWKAVNNSDFPAAGRTFTIEVGCAGAAGTTCDAINDRAGVNLYRATLFIRDDAAPAAAGLSGSLLEAGARRGLEPLAFTATDQGAGVRRAVLTVDGQQAASVEPQSSPGCVDAGFVADDPYEYRLPVPCAPSMPVSFAVDTRALGDGPHSVKVTISDGAGNTTVAVDRTISVDNTTPPPTPAPASGAAPVVVRLDDAATTRHVGYGKALKLSGVVLDAASKAPRAGVAVSVSQRILRIAGASSALPAVTTGADGRFSIPVDTSASRLLALQAPGVLLEVRVLVSAKLTIAAKPATLHRGGSLRLSGKVSLEGLPKRGVRVEIQSRWGGRWRSIDSVQSDRRGAWHWRYRVERATGSLPFRAVLVTSGELAAADGTSKTVNVRVR